MDLAMASTASLVSFFISEEFRSARDTVAMETCSFSAMSLMVVGFFTSMVGFFEQWLLLIVN